MVAGAGVFVGLWNKCIVIFSVSAHDIFAISLSCIVFVHDAGIFNVYDCMRNYWAGRNAGQLAVQYNDSWRFDDSDMRLGFFKSSSQMSAE